MRAFILFFILGAVLISAQDKDKFLTHFEASNYLESPNYEESIKYLNKLAEASPYLETFVAGKTPQGRDFYWAVVSEEKLFTADEIAKSEKPLIFIENGIHSGEIEGKDACFLLLREMLITGEKADLLSEFNFVIIPIFNIDGHERRSPYGRINQNGPTEMGWRTTAQNYNLNRDFLKADAPEMRMLLNLFTDYNPDFFIDTHTTNGSDYQYTVTYAVEKYENVPPSIRQWINKTYVPELEKRVEERGYFIGPYIGFVEGDMDKGAYDWSALPRLSEGYTAIRNRAGLLIETHMLKPYKDRVFSTKEVIEATLELVSEIPGGIKNMNKAADDFVIEEYYKNRKPFPLTLKRTEKTGTLIYKGIKYDNYYSEITGDSIKHYNGVPFDKELKFYNDMIGDVYVTAPEAYYLPAQFDYLLDRIEAHGVKVKRLEKDMVVKTETYKFRDVTFAKAPYESHIRPSYKYDVITGEETLQAGGLLISCDRKTLPVILHMFEPDGPDSFVQWGMFNMIFERKEYFEFYSMEPIAARMYQEDAQLRAEFDEKVKSDSAFAASPYDRLNFFYKRSKYYDQAHNVYPVKRVIK